MTNDFFWNKFSKSNSIKIVPINWNDGESDKNKTNTIVNESHKISGKSLARIKDLEKFINELKVMCNQNNIEFDPQDIPIMKDDLLTMLKEWEKGRKALKSERLWELTNMASDKVFWGSKERKGICNVLLNGKQNMRDENFFEKIMLLMH